MENQLTLMLLSLAFLLVATFYASVGFGGGSSYLALLALVAFPYILMPKVALLCNIIVVTGGSIIHFRKGNLKIKDTLPLVLTSIPFAYLGGSIQISKTIFLWLLAFSLLMAAIRLLFMNPQEEINKVKKLKWMYSSLIGAAIGLLSGTVGIGGGIFLAPILLISKWGKAREIAATASLFILVNSISGLTAQLIKHSISVEVIEKLLLLWPLPVAVFIGGQIGSRVGATRFSALHLKRLTGALILFVSVQIIFKLV